MQLVSSTGDGISLTLPSPKRITDKSKRIKRNVFSLKGVFHRFIYRLDKVAAAYVCTESNIKQVTVIRN